MRWWLRLRSLRWPHMLVRERDERDLDDEIRFDLAEEMRLRVERGESSETAWAAARREFGPVAAVKEQTRAVWGWMATERVAQDLRFAARTFSRSPGFTAAALLTLALGIGLCSFLFSSLNGIVLRPLPGAREAQRLAAIDSPVPYPYFEHYRDESAVASAVAAYLGPVPFSVATENTGNTQAERVLGHLVSPGYFATLGVEPLLGRWFDPVLERRGAAPGVVVSERFWRTRLHADSRAIGRMLHVNGQPATLLGVARKDFLGVFPSSPADIFVPVTANPAIAPELAGDVLDRTNLPVFRVVLRLAPHVTMTAAEAALEVQTRNLEEQLGKGQESPPRRPVGLIAAGGMVPWPQQQRSMTIVFFGLLMSLVLSFTCANLGGLMLARGSARGAEIAIRLSLGASRFRLVRQLLTESILLATVGGAAGLAAAYGLLSLLTHSVAGTAPFGPSIRLTPDLRVALLTFLVSALAGTGFGLLPALAATRPDLVTALKGASATGLGLYKRFGLRNLFLVYQMASAMALVLIMGILLSGLQRGTNRNPGFDPDGLYLFSLDPLRDGLSLDESAAVLRDLPERLMRLKGVEAAALADQSLSKLFATPNTAVSVPGAGAGEPESVHRVVVQSVGPGFFATLGVPVLHGAEFTDLEVRSVASGREPLPVVLNQSAASELFGDTEPLGRLIRQDGRVWQVAAIVRDDRPAPLRAKAPATVSLPLKAGDPEGSSAESVAVLVRLRKGAEFEEVREELQAVDGRLTMFNQTTMRENLARFEEGVGYVSAIYALLGIFALTLAGVGLAGVTSNAVVRRRKEIGIRMALGARPSQVLRLVLREGAAMVVVGSLLGLAGGFAITRVLGAISAQAAGGIAWSLSEPMRILAAPVLLILVAAIACYLPARRSVSFDPLVALREE